MTVLSLIVALAAAAPPSGPPMGPPHGPPPPPHVVLAERVDAAALSPADLEALDAALADTAELEALEARARAAHVALMEAERAWLDALEASLSPEAWEAVQRAVPPPPPRPPVR
jgi:hypothetical protein